VGAVTLAHHPWRLLRRWLLDARRGGQPHHRPERLHLRHGPRHAVHRRRRRLGPTARPPTGHRPRSTPTMGQARPSPTSRPFWAATASGTPGSARPHECTTATPTRTRSGMAAG
jgi:hypothetical protein